MSTLAGGYPESRQSAIHQVATFGTAEADGKLTLRLISRGCEERLLFPHEACLSWRGWRAMSKGARVR